MNVIFIYGPVASGKYTIAKSLSSKLNLPLFHNHLAVDLARSLFQFGSPGFCSLREKVWFATFEEAVKSKQSFIFTFTPEKTVSPDFIEKVCSIISEENCTISFIELICENLEIEKRISDVSRSHFGKINSLELYKKLKSENTFDFGPMPKPMLSINTTLNSIANSVEQIIKVL